MWVNNTCINIGNKGLVIYKRGEFFINLCVRFRNNFTDNVIASCGGKGICGKCKVRFVKEAPESLQKEKEILTEKELEEGWRLACMAKVPGMAYG